MPKVAFSEEEVGIVERGNVHFFQVFRVKSNSDVFSGHLSDEARFGPGVRNRAKGAHFLLRLPRLNPSSISSLRSSVGSLQCLEHSTLFHSQAAAWLASRVAAQEVFPRDPLLALGALVWPRVVEGLVALPIGEEVLPYPATFAILAGLTAVHHTPAARQKEGVLHSEDHTSACAGFSTG